MSDIWAIVTHHEDPDEAAEAWRREGVCAIGWDYGFDLRRVPQRVLRVSIYHVLSKNETYQGENSELLEKKLKRLEWKVSHNLHGE